MTRTPPDLGPRPRDGARRRLRAAQRRELILRAAIRLFAERGYHATSMEEIGAAAGVSKAVVYDHFASKDELYAHLLEEIRAEVDAALEVAIAPEPSSLRTRTAVETFFRFVEERPETCRLLILEIHRTTEVAEVVARFEDRVAAALASALASDPTVYAGHPERRRRVRVLAELLTSAFHGLASWWLRHPREPREEVVERADAAVATAIGTARR